MKLGPGMCTEFLFNLKKNERRKEEKKKRKKEEGELSLYVSFISYLYLYLLYYHLPLSHKKIVIYTSIYRV